MTNSTLERIEAAEKKLSEVFSDKYNFTIPPYQRPYAWELQQATELLDDLLDAHQINSRSEGFYFLGSIVLVKQPSAPESRVVDGQQRLTTLTILLSIIRDLTDGVEQKFARDKYIKQAANPDLGLPDRLRLQLRPNDQAFFEQTVQRCDSSDALPLLEGLDGSQARIVENAMYYRERLEKMSTSERDKLMRFVLTNCYLVVVEVPTDSAARRIFTVLNARGLDLIATDILKVDLLERAGGLSENDLSTRWEEIETALDRDRFNDLFTHIRMIYQREKPRSALEDGFPEFVPPFKGDPKDFIADTLEPYANALTLLEDNERLARQLDPRTAALVRSLNRLDNKDWEPPLLQRLRQYLDNQDVDLPKFIFELERLAYYLFVIRADVNTRMSRYADVLEQIDSREGRTTKTGGLDLGNLDVELFFEALDGAIYLRSRVINPLLLRLDLALSDGSAVYDYPIISVEHVLPQTIETGSQWDTWFIEREEQDFWLHRMANLVLLTRRKNSSASNWNFERKKATYFKRDDACPFLLTRQVLDVEEWTAEHLEQRQRSLLATLAKNWKIEKGFEGWLLVKKVL